MENKLESFADSENESDKEKTCKNTHFKKPTLLIGKIGRLPRKIQSDSSKNLENSPSSSLLTEISKSEDLAPKESIKVSDSSSVQQVAENPILLPYKEPVWSGLPKLTGKTYSFDVLKNGSIIETIDLMKKPFWVFGRLTNCDICMQHPTISRYHAILQYRAVPTEKEPLGFYIYDLSSTHGTFLNGKNKLKPKLYVPIRVGHMVRLGCSQRSYILMGPDEDQEQESELSVTELKELRAQKIAEQEEKARKEELEREERRKREEQRGVDWGLGDDADEKEDLSENPYAQTNNEELYLDDPKKALRGFFEREGFDLEYVCTEQGMGQFLCKVELPLDDEMGKSIVAEVLHRGKKKEAVEQCALEACRILDRFGVLRQATHESRKRKAKNWEENDYYDSDDDTFLDRTGTIEKKREKRMKVKESEKVETYETLLEKEKKISASITETENLLSASQAKLKVKNQNTNEEEDSLDIYMKGLQEEKLDKHSISKLKLELVKLKNDHENVIRLINIAKPANLPLLISQKSSKSTSSSNAQKELKLPQIGKRKGLMTQSLQKQSFKKSSPVEVTSMEREQSEEEEDEKSDDENKGEGAGHALLKVEETKSKKEGNKNKVAESEMNIVANNGSPSEKDSGPKNERALNVDTENLEVGSTKSLAQTNEVEKAETLMSTGPPPGADKYKEILEKVLKKLEYLKSKHGDHKILFIKKQKVLKLASELEKSLNNEQLKNKLFLELKKIMVELDTISEEKFKFQGKTLLNNQVKLSKKQHDEQKQRGYEEDSKKEDYCMWVPPSDQSGDGRTNLNDKYGY